MAIFELGKPNIRKMEAQQDVTGLVKALGYPKDAQVRREALEALVRIGDKAVVDALEHALEQHEEMAVREAAVEGLARIGSSAAREILIRALEHHSDLRVREAAARALGRLGEKRAVAGLAARATAEDEAQDVRLAAVEALGAIGDRGAIEPLLQALRVWELRRAAAKALARLGWQPARDEAAVHYWLAQEAWDQCAALGDVAIATLVELLKESARLGAYAQSMLNLEMYGGHYDLGFMGRMIGMKCLDMREVAGRALVKIGAPAVPKLIEAMKDETAWGCMTFAWALGEIGDARAVEPLITLLRWRDSIEQDCQCHCMPIAVLEALVKIGPPAIAPLLALSEQEQDPRMREEIQTALRQLGYTTL